MKSDLVIALILFSLVIGVGLGMLWRAAQTEPILKARIEYLEDERRALRMQLIDHQTQIGLLKGKGKKKRAAGGIR